MKINHGLSPRSVKECLTMKFADSRADEVSHKIVSTIITCDCCLRKKKRYLQEREENIEIYEDVSILLRPYKKGMNIRCRVQSFFAARLLNKSNQFYQERQ